ncbi:MAG TPA: glycosyltransferase family 4 protein [Bryobacteraceae bacterium]|jgi:glycosyltransferase involved in cell wall biosynthesis
MNILLVHNSYQQPGGEDRVFQMEADLLRSHSHRVILYQSHNDDVSRSGRAVLFAKTIWNRQSYSELRRVIRDKKIDLVHLHNTFPLISPSAYYAAAAERVPVVQTLHNYRLLCPAATLYRDGRICEACVGQSIALPAVLHSCYRASRSASFASTAMLASHRVAGTWQHKVSTYIALTDFAREKFIEGGLPEARIRVKPNFIDPDPGVGPGTGKYALFMGRLTPEKGVRTLLEAWKILHGAMPLEIAGEGPLVGETRAAAAQIPNVFLRGWMPRQHLQEMIRQAAVVIVPSEWYEPFGLTIAEAFAAGVPVIASRLGSLTSMVRHRETGLLFEAGRAADLAAQVRWLLSNPDESPAMRVNARREFEENYTGERNYQLLMSIYSDAQKDRDAGKA